MAVSRTSLIELPVTSFGPVELTALQGVLEARCPKRGAGCGSPTVSRVLVSGKEARRASKT